MKKLFEIIYIRMDFIIHYNVMSKKLSLFDSYFDNIVMTYLDMLINSRFSRYTALYDVCTLNINNDM
jgi:hypothetical protein